MRLSVITVSLNNVDGLQKTMKSLLSQTWDDWEYIVIDGGSNDGSKEIIEESANGDKRLSHWVSEKDDGIFNAMNKGVKVSTGDYLLFLNSGDYLNADNVLEEVFEGNQPKYTQDFICARCAVSNNGVVEFITNPPQNLTFKDFFNTTLAHQSTFIKRELFQRYGLYREDLKLKSDWEFFVRTIILNKCTTISIGVILTDYNLDGVSSLISNKIRQKEEMEKIYEETVLSKFIADYISYNETLKGMKVYFWAKEKWILNWAILFIFKIANMFSKAKKSV
ncbi:MAG: glycosyltransferase involved in cell wall biosynthesis [Patiriisocius sp.]|jgi:glycosyltransferase involved in cell wall biosynthesis